MDFERLKIIGFKSFADPVDILIPRGLTGVIGPNGCGKSNLVEAMRWVMGESSSKAMRANDMDSVIFAGSSSRPARNFAEVIITLNNDDRSAPAIFNHEPMLEVSRKLVRESGSAYRVNHREARARDVQMLFADAATGARSPSMVRQGQISELIMAKPQARRRILEDAAGISGLAARRHEAELRLNAAASNLEKLEQTALALEQQQSALQKQAREASKYRRITQEMQALELKIAYRQLEEADGAATSIAAQLEDAQTSYALAQEQLIHAETLAATAAQRVASQRTQLEETSHKLQELKAAQKLLTIEIARFSERRDSITQQRARVDEDSAREQKLLTEAQEQLDNLNAEKAKLEAKLPEDASHIQMAFAKLTQADAVRLAAEQAKHSAATELLHINSQKQMAQKLLDEAAAHVQQLEARQLQAEQERDAVLAGEAVVDQLHTAQTRHNEVTGQMETARQLVLDANAALKTVQTAFQAARDCHTHERNALTALSMEQVSLNTLLKPAVQGQFTAISASVSVDKGYEAAAAAALKDELKASPTHFKTVNQQKHDPALPRGSVALSAHVRGAGALSRRLAQIGVVETLSEYTAEQLHTGQKLVTKDGHILRWDGLHVNGAHAEAEAHYFTQKNRLSDVEALIPQAEQQLKIAETELHTAQAQFENAEGAVKAVLAQELALVQQLKAADEALRAVEVRMNAVKLTLVSKEMVVQQVSQNLEAARAIHAQRQTEMDAITLPESLEMALHTATETLAQAQKQAVDARVHHEQLVREVDQHAYRLQHIQKDIHNWQRRRDEAEWAVQRLAERVKQMDADIAEFAITSPQGMEQRIRQMTAEIAAAEQNLSVIQTEFADAEIAARAGDQNVRALQAQILIVRDATTRLEVQHQSAQETLRTVRGNVIAVMDNHHLTQEQLELQVGQDEKPQPIAALIDALEKLKRDRERLGGINLIAEAELLDVTARLETLQADQQDLLNAITQFRGAIASLNAEGRTRLNAAFEAVNVHFVRLFTTLFEGGEAELIRTQADDPLETGLEIIARPPGKKPQTLSLLSGGEQALTAMALIFAVFLTNPSPICVLDEVDAPLDDANVERFCRLLDEMKRQTSTRFMIITHNPITMAHMDQLYGVTMAERGVSQVVSVQLREAIELSEAA